MNSFRPEQESPSAKRSIGGDLVWSAVRHWTTRLGSLVLFLVLARILPAGDFGLFSAAIAVLALTEVFADNGVSEGIVQAPDVSPGIVSALFLVTSGLGVAIGVGIVLCAPYAERMAQTPGLGSVLMALAITLPLNAACIVQQAILRRDRQFSNLAQRALVATLLSGAVGLTGAMFGLGVWSLVLQYLTMSAVNSAYLWIRDPVRLVAPDVRGAAGLLRYGVQSLASRLVYYANTRLIELVLLYHYGAETLGYYIMGSRIAFVLSQLLIAVVVDVFLPIYARLASDRLALAATFDRSLELACLVLTPVFIGTAAIAPDLCQLAFGEKGAAAVRFLEISALVVAVQAPSAILSNLVSAIGRPSVALGSHLAFCALGLALMAPDWGFAAEDLVALCGLAGALVILPYAWVVSRIAGLRLFRILSASAPYFVASAVLFVAVRASAAWSASALAQPAGRIALQVLCGAVVYGLSVLVMKPNALQLLRTLRRA